MDNKYIVSSYTFYFPLEVRENILRFTGNNFVTVLKGILGGEDIHNNFLLLLDRLTLRFEVDNFPEEIITYQLPDGKYHHSKRSSYVKRKCSIPEEKQWYIFGSHYNKTDSSIKYLRSDGQIKEECWYSSDLQCRGNKMIRNVIYYDDCQNILHPTCTRSNLIEKEFYYKNGLFHRDEGCATITYYIDGQINTEMRWELGRHKDGLSSKSYYDCGEIKQEVWYKNDKAYKVIKYDRKGLIEYEDEYHS